jgi:hypothetical protein
MGVPKFPNIGLSCLWGPITLSTHLHSNEVSYSPCQDLFNGISHATCMQGNWSNSRLLIPNNLSHGPPFGPNLCVKCPNGSWKPILDIYILRAFHWYKECLNPMGFDPCNFSLKPQEFIRTLIPKVRAHLGMWRFIPSHSPTFPRAWNVTPMLPPWPAPLQTLALVTNPRLRLWQ